MTHEQSTAIGYLINGDYTLKAISFGDYLRQYWSDEFPSPRGIEPRLFISIHDGNYVVKKWEVFGQTIMYSHEEKEECEMWRLDQWARDYYYSSTNAPSFFESKAEAIQTIADRTNHSVQVVERFLTMKEVTAKRIDALLAEDMKKEGDKTFALAQANSIVPDDQLIEDMMHIKHAEWDKATRNRFTQLVFSNFLKRKELRVSDFWLFLKIVTKKALNSI